MATIYANFLSGTTLNNPLTPGASIIESVGFSSIPAIVYPNTMWLVLDPKGIDGEPEITQILAHEESSTVLTVTRAQQGSFARTHNAGTYWINAVTKDDLDSIITSINVLSAATTSLTTTTNNLTNTTNALTTTTNTLSGITSTQFGFRNLFINGNMDIWQRGFGPFATGFYTADQFRGSGSGTTASITAVAHTQGSIAGYEPTYFQRNVVTSSAGAGNYHFMCQKVEGVRTLAGQTCTFSFWAKADAVKNIAVEIYQEFGTGGSPSAGVSIPLGLIALSTSWARYSVTTTLPSIAGKTLGSNGDNCILPIIWMDAGSTFAPRASSLGQQSGTFDFWGWQLERGSQMTAFETRPIQLEQQLCYRYYQRLDYNAYFGVGQCFGGTAAYAMVPYRGKLGRAASAVNFPAASNFGTWGSGGAGEVISAISNNAAGLDSVRVSCTTPVAHTAGDVFILFNNSGSAYIEIVAEL